jgi:hypothetical protein
MADPVSLIIIGIGAVAVMTGTVAILATLPDKSTASRSTGFDNARHSARRKSMSGKHNSHLIRNFGIGSPNLIKDHGKVV